MKKALAQNPNLLRTLIGLSLTLIFMLSYAVYGATVSPSVYVYTTEATVTTFEEQPTNRIYDSDENETTWLWQFSANGKNLTWVNASFEDLSDESIVRITSTAKLYSHELLGITYQPENPQDDEFSCAESCYHNITHQRISDTGGELEFHGLTSVDPARRSNGSVFAQSLEEAREKAGNLVAYNHTPSVIRIEIIEQGNRSTEPYVAVETVNEILDEVDVFSVDAATEFLWAFAAVVGCFSIVLIPSFTVYFAARAKEKRDEAKLESAQERVTIWVESESE
ncbi:MAG: hypothetical protein L7S56_00485 [Candidatus Poseidonia sp.]|nr:hypothetical protein [Poseidonia sp.]